MLLAAVMLNFFVAFLLGLLALRYAFGPAPAEYHQEILAAAGAEVTGTHKGIFRALNVVVGAGFFAQTVVIATVTYFGVWSDVFWAKLLVLVLAVICGVPAMIAAQRLERHSHVTTPWRSGLFMLAVSVTAFVLSLL